MDFHPPTPPSLRRNAAWPAWPRRLGVVASADRRHAQNRLQIDWPLLLFWVGYLALFATGAWLIFR